MYTEKKSIVPVPSSRPSRLLSRERHSFITLCLSRGSLCVYRHECQLPFKQPSFGRQGRGGHVSDGAFLEAVLCSLQTGSQAQQFQLWHSVLKIEIPVCQDRDWRILLMHFCSGQKEGEEKEEKKERKRKYNEGLSGKWLDESRYTHREEAVLYWGVWRDFLDVFLSKKRRTQRRLSSISFLQNNEKLHVWLCVCLCTYDVMSVKKDEEGESQVKKAF